MANFKIKTIIIMAVLFMMPGRLLGEENGLTLSSLLQTARRENPEIASARSRWESAGDLVGPAGSPPFPSAGFMLENASADTVTMQVYSIMQRYPFPGKLSTGRKIQSSQSRIRENNYRAVELKVFEDLSKAFWQAVYHQEVIDILNEEIEIVQSYARAARGRYESGDEVQMNVIKAQMEVARIEDELLIHTEDLLAEKARINALLGRPSRQSLERLLFEKKLGKDLPGRESISETVVEKNPQIRSAAERTQKAGYARRLERMEYLPDFSFSYRRKYMEGDFSDWDVGVNISVPLYFGAQASRVGGKRKEEEAVRESYSDTVNMKLAELERVYSNLNKFRRLYQTHESDYLPRLEQLIKNAEAGYKAGRVSFLDLLDAQRSYLRFAKNSRNYLVRYKKALAELNSLIGTAEITLQGDKRR